MQKFSVLMSIYYNEKPKYFDLCLRSILIEQTILPDEIVLVKDGKLTEELEFVIEKYQKKFPRIFNIIALEDNVGLGNALNIGLAKCKYDIVMRMDSDDISVPERFEKQLKYMMKHKDVSVLGGFIGEFKDDKNKIERIKTMPCSYDEVKKYAKFRNPMNHMTVCFRKKDILEVGNYQPLFYLEDHYLWARVLVNNKKIENLPYVLVYARVGNGFISRRGNKNYIKGWKKLQNYLYENKIINFVEKSRNILGMYVMVYIPDEGRAYLYDNVLRKKYKSKR